MGNLIEPKEQFDLNSITKESYVIQKYFEYSDGVHLELRAYNREEGFTRWVGVPLDIFKAADACIGDIVRVDYSSQFTVFDLGKKNYPVATYFEKPEGHVITNRSGNFLKKIESDNPRHPFYGKHFVF